MKNVVEENVNVFNPNQQYEWMNECMNELRSVFSYCKIVNKTARTLILKNIREAAKKSSSAGPIRPKPYE